MAKEEPTNFILNTPKRPRTKLSFQQREFCEAYLAQGPLISAVKAAEKAGYKNARMSAYELLKMPVIQAYIEKRCEQTRLRNNIHIDDLVNELVKMVMFDPRNLYDDFGNIKDPKLWDDFAAAAITSIEVSETRDTMADSTIGTRTKSIKRSDKLAAINLLADLLGFKKYMQVKVRRDRFGNVLETEQTVSTMHQVIFTDNSNEPDAQPDQPAMIDDGNTELESEEEFDFDEGDDV